MRRLRVFESISIDGYFVDAHGDMSWAHNGRGDPEFAEWVAGNASSDGELLFGRKTYQMMQAFWTTSEAAQQMPVVAKSMNEHKKYVVSRTIQPTWNNAQLLKGELTSAVRELKERDGPGIALLGSGSIAGQLGEAGLVDEYQFVIIPVALAEGRTIFTGMRNLRLVRERTFRCGNVALTYETT